MPQLRDNQQQNPRHRVVAVMTRAQEDALHQLRRDGVSEAYALAVMQRISSLCLQTLRELDQVYREFEELLAADRSGAHQEWFETKAGGLLLSLEALIAAVVAEASNNAKAAYHDDDRHCQLNTLFLAGLSLNHLGWDWLAGAAAAVGDGGEIRVGAYFSPHWHWHGSVRSLVASHCGGRVPMSDYDWILSAGAPLCLQSDSFYYTSRDTVFRQPTKDTTPEQFQAARESLERLRDELQQAVYPMHYGSLVGRHRCVDHLYREAVARLRNLELMQPAPKPPPPPKQQLITRDGIVIDLEEKLQTNRTETHLGTDDTQLGNRNTR